MSAFDREAARERCRLCPLLPKNRGLFPCCADLSTALDSLDAADATIAELRGAIGAMCRQCSFNEDPCRETDCPLYKYREA